MAEESLSFLQPSFPGWFVLVQFVIALASDGTQELFDCTMTARGNTQFVIKIDVSCTKLIQFHVKSSEKPFFFPPGDII